MRINWLGLDMVQYAHHVLQIPLDHALIASNYLLRLQCVNVVEDTNVIIAEEMVIK